MGARGKYPYEEYNTGGIWYAIMALQRDTFNRDRLTSSLIALVFYHISMSLFFIFMNFPKHVPQ